MKKKLIALGLAFAMLAVASIGATLAYFTDTDSGVNVFTIGNIDIELYEEAGVLDKNDNPIPGRTVKFGDASAVYTNIMPTNKIQKDVTVKNVGDNDAYVRVAIIVNNHDKLTAAIDDYYEDKKIYGVEYPKNGDAIEAIYDDVFAGWGISYQKADGEGGNDLRGAMTSTAGIETKGNVEIIGVDSYRTTGATIRGYELLTSKNNTYGLKGQNNCSPNVDDATGAIMNGREMMYVFYLKLESDASANLIDGLNVPAYFDNDQMKFFNGLKIEVYADAIQAEGFDTAADAFAALEQSHPMGKIERLTAQADKNLVDAMNMNIVNNIEDIQEALKNGEDIVLGNNISCSAQQSNAYGITLLNINGQTIDGNGYTLGSPDSTGTWDSAVTITTGTIKNVTINKGFRGIFIKGGSERVYIDNVTIDGTTYTISCDQASGQGLTATGSTFNGWTSYAGTLGDAIFNACSFGRGNGYAFCRPYAPTQFISCDFEAGFQMDPRAAVTFENCTIGGVPLNAANLATLVTSNIQNATVIG